MNLPTHSTFEQGTAHLRANSLAPLLLHSAPCQAVGVMVAHVRAQSVSSVRYPSPAGRCGPPPRLLALLFSCHRWRKFAPL